MGSFICLCRNNRWERSGEDPGKYKREKTEKKKRKEKNRGKDKGKKGKED